MIDKSHEEQIERWAKFVKENPDKWKPELNRFLDAQINMANAFYKRLAKTKEGRDKIRKLRNLRMTEHSP